MKIRRQFLRLNLLSEPQPHTTLWVTTGADGFTCEIMQSDNPEDLTDWVTEKNIAIENKGVVPSFRLTAGHILSAAEEVRQVFLGFEMFRLDTISYMIAGDLEEAYLLANFKPNGGRSYEVTLYIDAPNDSPLGCGLLEFRQDAVQAMLGTELCEKADWQGQGRLFIELTLSEGSPEEHSRALALLANTIYPQDEL